MSLQNSKYKISEEKQIKNKKIVTIQVKELLFPELQLYKQRLIDKINIIENTNDLLMFIKKFQSVPITKDLNMKYLINILCQEPLQFFVDVENCIQ